MFLVRLKPFNGKNHVLRTYTVASKKFVGGDKPAWYGVDDDLAKVLKKVKQVSEDSTSADAFDVCSEEEAAAIDEAERGKHLGTVAQPIPATGAPPMRVHNVSRTEASRAASAVGTVTTADLPRASAPEPSGEFTDDMNDDPGDRPTSPTSVGSAPTRVGTGPKRSR